MNDLISRQAAIDEVHKVMLEFFDLCDDDEESPITEKEKALLKINKKIANSIKALPSAQPEPRWIPCNERLPIIKNNIGTRVLITTSWGLVKEAHYCVDHWEVDGISYKLTSATAWMPLPEPWKGEDDECTN